MDKQINKVGKPRADFISRVLNKVDGWTNILAGLGKRGTDKTRETQFGNYTVLEDNDLTNIWLGEGLGKKIVGSVADDMTRNWITIENDEKNKLLNALTLLSAETKVNEALKWARLYRGSIIVVGANDGRALNEPLAVNSVKSIDWLKVYAAPRIKIQQTDIVTDPNSVYFEDVEIFPIQKMNGEEINVHHSRCLVFKGDPVPNTSDTDIDFQNLYWGTSILQAIWDRVRNIGGIEQGISNLMLEVVIGKYKLSNLAEILAANNTEAVYNRMEIINASKSLINAVLLGENEDYTRDTANLTGVPDVMDRFMMMLSAVAEIPVTRLFGRSPAGQNATGESDLRTYYDMVKSKQKTWLQPPLQVLVLLVNSVEKVVTDPIISFNPVWEPSPAELLKMKKEQAEIDKTYIEQGVMDSDEVREQRLMGGYSFDMSVDSDITEKEKE